MSESRRKKCEYTESEMCQLKGKPALVAKENGEYELCTIQEVVYIKKYNQYVATIQKNERKSYLKRIKIWLATHQNLISLSSSSKSSHVPMGRVFPLIDVQREDDKCESPWQSVSGKRLGVERLQHHNETLFEIQSEMLRPNDFVFISNGESSEPIIGKVRKVFAKELNIPTGQIFADVLFEHRISAFGTFATPYTSPEFNWRMVVRIRDLKRLGDEIILKDKEGSEENPGINKVLTNDYDDVKRNLISVLEEGILIRRCNKYEFGNDITNYYHPKIYLYMDWNVLYHCTSNLEYSGRLDFDCVKLFSEIYFQVRFERNVKGLENLLHGASCSGNCDGKDFLVNEKQCNMLHELNLLTIKASADEEIKKTDLTLVKKESHTDAEVTMWETKLNTTDAKLQYLAAVRASGESKVDVGIEGGINSCYLDVSLFIMFCFDNSFDEVLGLGEATEAYKDAAAIESLKNIACLLREEFFVPSHLTNELRKSLSNINSGFSASYMDVEELFCVLFTQIFPTSFFELNNGGKDLIHQLLVPMPQEYSTPVMHKTTQEMLEQSFHEYKVKFSNRPHPVMMIKLPYCDGKAYFGCEGVVPSKVIDLLSILDSTGLFNTAQSAKLELYGIICLKSSHYTCFAKTGHTEDAPWVYFDSGSVNRKCQVTLLPEFGKDLETIEQNVNKLDLKHYKSDHGKYMQFMLRHIYLCFYRPLQ